MPNSKVNVMGSFSMVYLLELAEMGWAGAADESTEVVEIRTEGAWGAECLQSNGRGGAADTMTGFY